MNNMVQNAMPYNFDPRSNGVNPNYDPQAAKDFANYVPNLMGATAWHGTPHNILGKFDISKVGTGEGAQAYGHGMYFAENPAVAKEYQKIVQGPESTAQHYLQMYKTPENAISVLESGLTPNLTAEAKKHSLDAINVLKSGKELKGNLYKVDIPDEYIPNMLDWDKPLNQQSDVVKQALGLPEDKFAGFRVPATGTNYSFSPNWRGEDFYKALTDLSKTQAGASEMLNSMGIKGIRYKDAMSRNADKGTSNFVVFDPSTVKILEENSKPLTRKELIEQQLNKVIE